MVYPLWQLQTELFLMELEHLTVLLSFILFPCIIFGLGLVLLFLRRWITNTVMHVISSMYCRASFVNQTFKTKHHKWSHFFKILYLSLVSFPQTWFTRQGGFGWGGRDLGSHLHPAPHNTYSSLCFPHHQCDSSSPYVERVGGHLHSAFHHLPPHKYDSSSQI